MTFGDVGFKSTVEALSKEVPCRFGGFFVVGGSPPPFRKLKIFCLPPENPVLAHFGTEYFSLSGNRNC